MTRCATPDDQARSIQLGKIADGIENGTIDPNGGQALVYYNAVNGGGVGSLTLSTLSTFAQNVAPAFAAVPNSMLVPMREEVPNSVGAAADSTSIAIVQDGKVIASDNTGTLSHEALADRSGVLVQRPAAGIPGTLAPGAEAVTVTNKGGTTYVQGSLNFQGVNNVSPSAEAAARKAFGN